MNYRLAIAASAAATLIFTAPTANAQTPEELYFLDLQRQHGWTIWDPAQHLRAAHWACDLLNRENGVLVIEDLVDANPGISPADHAVFLYDAVTAICPWHDHTRKGI